MDTFLHETAQRLYDRYGEEISSLSILFPSRRARLFFNEALAEIAGKPLWQPHYTSMDEVMEGIAGIRKSDNIRLIAELYKVYSKYHTEGFDSFYFWGEILLSDFDSIDKYMIDAAMLFINIADLKTLESDLSYLTEEQVRIISQFWRNFNIEDLTSPEKQHFVKVWNSLLEIYTDFRARLAEIGLAYPGMIYRTAAEKMLRDRTATDLSQLGITPERDEQLTRLLEKHYAVIGFNALSESEKILFSYLERRKAALFFWDYDTYYTEHPEQEAGMFLRENIRRFPSADTFPKRTAFSEEKEIVAVAAPSDAMQCKYVSTFLNGLTAAGKKPDKETAIVLTDENLLLPVLYSIPEGIEEVNITMGYPLRQTPAYTFVERLIELQQHKKTRGEATLFYHADATGILNHPYVIQAAGASAPALAEEILTRQQIYIPARKFAGNEILSEIFTPVNGWESLCEYLIDTLATLGRKLRLLDDGDMQAEFFSLIVDNIYKLENSLKGCGIEITDSVLLSLLRKVLQSVRVPYDGEPLAGVQVMGILETRNLDFENVVILSVNDDTFPGNLSASSSFIPYNLRLAYGLPTPQHHEGVFGYYFYRLVQRAKRVHMVYSVKADDKKTGEPSRYIYQLDYESPHAVEHREITLNISFPERKEISIEKDASVMQGLQAFTGTEGTRKLSPSTFYSYVECPLKFYFQSIARLREEDEISEEVDLPMFGNILHKAAELIYGELKGKPHPEQLLQQMINGPEVDKAVDRAVASEYFKDEKNTSPEDFGGNLTLISDIVKKYLNTCLLAYDARHGGFVVQEVEKWIDSTIRIGVGGQELPVRFGGKVDRLDLLSDGALRVVDYKTGSRKDEFRGIEALFSERHADRNPAALQTLLYSLLLNHETRQEVTPSLYFIRYMNTDDYSPLLNEIQTDERGKKTATLAVNRFTDYKEQLTEHLHRTLAELFDPSVPFRQCTDARTCGYCPYREICRR